MRLTPSREDKFTVEKLVSIASNNGATQALSYIKSNWAELVRVGRFDVDELVETASNDGAKEILASYMLTENTD